MKLSSAVAAARLRQKYIAVPPRSEAQRRNDTRRYIRRYMRIRYRTDPDFRERVKAKAAARYQTDPDYRERAKARGRAQWCRIKADPEIHQRYLELKRRSQQRRRQAARR